MRPSRQQRRLEGQAEVAAGRIATVVTYLELFSRPEPRGSSSANALSLARIGPDLARYRALFRAVGEDWLWFSRLVMPDDGLSAILRHPAVEAYALREGDRDVGLLELDFRPAHEAELAFFGLVPELIGRGAGSFMMEQGLDIAFAKPIRRLFVHTCTLDHSGALAFYQRAGFKPYRRVVEIAEDPRLRGHLPLTSAPHHPVIGG